MSNATLESEVLCDILNLAKVLCPCSVPNSKYWWCWFSFIDLICNRAPDRHALGALGEQLWISSQSYIPHPGPSCPFSSSTCLGHAIIEPKEAWFGQAIIEPKEAVSWPPLPSCADSCCSEPCIFWSLGCGSHGLPFPQPLFTSLGWSVKSMAAAVSWTK